jgi:hypothetical protein
VFLFLVWATFAFVGLAVGRAWAFLAPVAVMGAYLVLGAVNNEVGDGTFTEALSSGGTLALLAGVLVVAEAGTLMGVRVRQRFARRFAKPS